MFQTPVQCVPCTFEANQIVSGFGATCAVLMVTKLDLQLLPLTMDPSNSVCPAPGPLYGVFFVIVLCRPL